MAYKGVLKAIIYADLFDFPLTVDELYFVVIDEKVRNPKDVQKALQSLATRIVIRDGLVVLQGREKLFSRRRHRDKESFSKQELALVISRYLQHIPLILFVGVSGSVAVGNAESEDDIDLFVIARHDHLWTTRLITLLFLTLLGRRRKKNARDVRDMFCINMLISDQSLCLPKQMQSLYTAHEILQVMPLFSRENMYEEFIQANAWIDRYLPNARSLCHKRKGFNVLPKKKSGLLSHEVVERMSRFIQQIKMGRGKKNISTDQMMHFFPKDRAISIEDHYRKKLEELT